MNIVNRLKLPRFVVSSFRWLHNTNQKIYIETYGCQMNFSDSEIVLSILTKNGYARVQNLAEANVALLMTCAIREGAEQKIWDRLLQIKAYKMKRSNPITIGVLGCMAERVKERLLESPRYGVNVVCGPDAYRDLPRLLQAAESGHSGMNVALSLEETYADVRPVRLCTQATSAFVSVQRGCDNMCSYCIVPWTRGKERSRPLTTVVNEVKDLVSQGVREVVLLGQNVNSYRDTSDSNEGDITALSTSSFKTIYRPKKGGHRFADLLDAVSSVDPELRVRFTSPHPKDFPEPVLKLIAERPNICKQLHLPAQSGSTAVLERMSRGYSREAYLELVEKVREMIPGVGLSSDFIAGFCGESEEEHLETLSLIEMVKYSFVYCFPYSMREKTKAHRRLVDDVPDDVKSRRHQEIAQVFRHHTLQRNLNQIGQFQLVLVEGTSKRNVNDLYGRNENNIKVIIPQACLPVLHEPQEPPRAISIGDYVIVEISDASSQVLQGSSVAVSTLQDFYSHKDYWRQPQLSDLSNPWAVSLNKNDAPCHVVV